jgi:hypothetical protein
LFQRRMLEMYLVDVQAQSLASGFTTLGRYSVCITSDSIADIKRCFITIAESPCPTKAF